MTKTTLKIAALLLASTTLVSTAEAGGVRLSFGGPLGSFTAHPNYSSGPGGNTPKKHCAKSYDRSSDKPAYAKPSYVGRTKKHDEDEAPVRKAKRAAPKIEVAETPAPRKAVKVKKHIEVAEETPAPKKIRKPKVVVEQPEEKPAEIKTAKVEDKSVATDAAPSIFVPEAPPARTEDVVGTQSTNAVIRTTTTTTTTAALTPAAAPIESVKAEEAKPEEAAKPAEAKKVEVKAGEKTESTAEKICRKFSAAIAGLVEIPCGN